MRPLTAAGHQRALLNRRVQLQYHLEPLKMLGALEQSPAPQIF
jgi:hypothetical protein